ncbi:MAG: 1-deoxy-D-xylulose-5-phosphate synthase [Thermoguttaceae bacterium]|nr:1-deoxy-D-xylulose-5-phosphate synthase [Thermoguttaceae bacterium]
MNQESDHPLLPEITACPARLKELAEPQLEQVAREIREILCHLSEKRSVHFASNLGVVELAVALHSSLDFTKDRLVWDTGHQCYPHKILTGRFPEIESIRTLGGLMGYPNPEESPFDLFMTGHAGCSIGSALGLSLGDAILRPEEERHAFAVVGDGALASGVIFEALNLAGGLKHPITVILNDNKMSICGRVGGLGLQLDRLRLNPTYKKIKNAIRRAIDAVPSVGTSTGDIISRFKDSVKAGITGGMLFEEFGIRYIGPIDGHNIPLLRRYLTMVRRFREPALLHILTEKGHGYRDAELDPTRYHAPSPSLVGHHSDPPADGAETRRGKAASVAIPETRSARSKQDRTAPVPPAAEMLPNDSDPDMPGDHSFTHWARNAIYRLMKEDRRFCVLTAAMAQGTMLEPIRRLFPDRFFDVGICEANAVVTASGLAKAGMRPIVDIYSTFLQRAYDHLFQEVSLQNLPVIFMIDRAGVVGADGPTHHGVFDLAYLRPFPHFHVMAPADAREVEPMLRYAAAGNFPAAIRYPRTTASRLERIPAPIETGKAEILRRGTDGAVAVLGERAKTVLEVADELAALPEGERLDLEVINARFAKPLDTETLLAPLREGKFLLTVEEGILAGGFGSALLEAASDAGVNTQKVRRLGIGDAYTPHGSRDELLRLLGLDKESLRNSVRKEISAK